MYCSAYYTQGVASWCQTKDIIHPASAILDPKGLLSWTIPHSVIIEVMS